jgi:putative holliday junction resolvase
MSLTEQGRLLGIDHGSQIIGLAICDANWTAARPLQLLARKSRSADFAALREIMAVQHIAGIVVGLPVLPEDKNATSQASTVERWATRLAAAVNVPVYLWDERYSTQEAEELRDSRDTERIDHIAAAVILQGFIDAHAEGIALPQPLK